MSTVLYDKRGLKIVRAWEDGPVLEVTLFNRKTIVIHQVEVQEILPVLQGFAASRFSDESEI